MSVDFIIVTYGKKRRSDCAIVVSRRIGGSGRISRTNRFEEVRSAMLRAALDAIIVMDESGTTLEFNPSAQRIFGYTREEACGRLVADLIIPPAHRETHRQGLKHYLATGESPIIDKHIYELTGIRKSGEEFPVELTVCPVMVSGRHLFCGFLRDLGEAVQGEDDTATEQATG